MNTITIHIVMFQALQLARQLMAQEEEDEDDKTQASNT